MERLQISRTSQTADFNWKALRPSVRPLPSRPSLPPLLQFSRALGNRAMGGFLQAKLKMDEPDDINEKEADQGGRMPEPSLPDVSRGSGNQIQRKYPACAIGQDLFPEYAEEEKMAQRKAHVTNSSSGDAPPLVHEVLNSPLQPQVPSTRGFFETRFGHDFSQMRVHTDARAVESAHIVGALANTVASHAVLAHGAEALASSDVRPWVAHERAHAVQQYRGHGVLQREPAKDNASVDRPAASRICRIRAGATKLVIKGDNLIDLPVGTLVQVEGPVVTDKNSISWATVVVTKSAQLDLVGSRGSIQTSSLSECAEPPSCVTCIVNKPPYTPQPSGLVCWAAAATMLVNWHDSRSDTIEQVVGKTFGYLEKFKQNKALPHEQFANFLYQLQIKVGTNPPADPGAWCDLLKKHGPIGVTFPAGKYTHEVIVYGIEKDSSSNGCFVDFHDPNAGVGADSSLSFSKFDALVGFTKAPDTVALFHY